MDLPLPQTHTGAPLWPKLDKLHLRCTRAGLMDVLTLLFHAPHLTMLHLQFEILFQPRRQIASTPSSTPRLCELSVELMAEPSDQNRQQLGLMLLQGVFDLYDPTALERIKLENAVIPRCGFPLLCPRLQDVHVKNVVLPHDFIEGLNRLPLIHRIVISESRIQETAPLASNEDKITTGLTFNGSTFTGAFTKLESLALIGVVIYPEFLAHLAQYSCLEELYVRVLSIEADPNTAEVDWLEVEAINPLPKLGQLYFNFGPAHATLPLDSFDTPVGRYIIPAVAQFGSSMAYGDIDLRPAPLRAADVSRLICRPDRALSNVEIQFSSEDTSPEMLSIIFMADTAVIREETNYPESLALAAGIMRIELAEVIFNRFPVEDDMAMVSFDEEALSVARMASEQNPEAVGLQYLLRHAQADDDIAEIASDG